MGYCVLATRITLARNPKWLIAIALICMAGCASAPKAAAPEKKGYSFWPPAPDEPHIQFLVAYNNSMDVVASESGFSKLIYGKESRQAYLINKPYGVRMWNGCIYVCDVRSKGITVLDLRKQQTRIMGATGVMSIGKAVDVAIAPDGTKYVVDAAQTAVLVYTSDEKFAASFPLPGSSPVGIAVFGDLLYVADFKNAQVRVLNRQTGVQIRTIGERGGQDGQFIGPLGVAADKEGNIYVSDTIKTRVQKFSPDGKLIMAFGVTGNRMGDFVRPKQLGVGGDGQIHVVDAAFNNVQVFDPEGKIVGYYGAAGRHPGAMDLPAGLDVHETDFDLFAQYVHPAFEVERLVLVANQFGTQKISVYAMGHLKPGKTVADIAAGRGSVAAGVAATQPTTAPVGSTSHVPSR